MTKQNLELRKKLAEAVMNKIEATNSGWKYWNQYSDINDEMDSEIWKLDHCGSDNR